MSLNTRPYKGARDFYPEDLRLRNYIFQNWREVCKSFGYEEYDSPILEPMELFSAKSGDELVNQQSYNFIDRGGREVVIRPEMTPSVSRMVAARRQDMPLPIRLFSIPNCWRYERPQKGRGREFYQLNIDMFGVSNQYGEVEMLDIIRSIMKRFNAKQDMYEIRVNSRKIMGYILGDWLGLDEVEQKTISRLIDRMHKMPLAEFIGLVDASVPPTLRENGVAQKLIDVLKISDISELPEEIRETQYVKDVQSIIQKADELGVNNIVYDITLMRGLDYYTDFVFEVFDTDPDNNRAMFGGGRYNGLVELFGVEQLPTIGLGMSDVMLLEFLKGHNLLPDIKTEIEAVIVPIGDVIDKAQRLASEFRDMKVNVSVDITERKTDKQIKSAVKLGVEYIIFIGENEIASEQYKIKNLTSGAEEVHSVQRIVSIIKDHRRS